jgi:hypothetical protein
VVCANDLTSLQLRQMIKSKLVTSSSTSATSSGCGGGARTSCARSHLTLAMLVPLVWPPRMMPATSPRQQELVAAKRSSTAQSNRDGVGKAAARSGRQDKSVQFDTRISIGANLSLQIIKNKKRKGKDRKWRETLGLKKFVSLVSNFESRSNRMLKIVGRSN